MRSRFASYLASTVIAVVTICLGRGSAAAATPAAPAPASRPASTPAPTPAPASASAPAPAPAPASPAPAPSTPTPAPASTPAPAPSNAVKTEARERFDTGLHLFEKGENAGALAEFKRAYQLIPNPLVLYNMGLVYAAMNRPVESVDALSQFLADAGTANAEQKAHGEQVRNEQTRRIAQLVVLTDHPATVEVDGVEVGRTPLSKPIRVPSGSHVVAVQAPGFLGSRREVTLAGQITETIAMTMQPTDTRMAQLVVSAALPGAEVVVNGKRVGVTPLPASVAVPPGKVSVELQRAGYRTATQTIALDEGARGELSFTLEEDPAAPASLRGRLVITVSEADAELSIDGSPRRGLTGPLSLPVGPHRVHLERGGFEPADRSVEVNFGQDASLLVTLVPTAETKARADSSRQTRKILGWSLVAGGAALAVGGGVFAAVAQGDIKPAQDNLTEVLQTEKDASPTNLCYAGTANVGRYMAAGCDVIKSNAQSDVDSAKLKRNLAIGGAAVGAIVAGVGTYLLFSGSGTGETGATGVTTAQVWGDGQGGAGLLLGGRF
jgi:PEGA domain